MSNLTKYWTADSHDNAMHFHDRMKAYREVAELRSPVPAETELRDDNGAFRARMQRRLRDAVERGQTTTRVPLLIVAVVGKVRT